MNEPTGFAGYAGFWKRLAAYVIDNILTTVAVYILAFFCGVAVRLSGGGEAEAMAMGLIIGLAVPWLYWSIMESSPQQATLGKMALGIIVTDAEGNRISWGRATARYWGKIVSTLILLLGFVMAGWTDKKQALHDIMAGCLVVNKKRAMPPV